MTMYTLCEIESATLEMTSKERVVHGTEKYLTFIRVDKELYVNISITKKNKHSGT